MQECKCRCKKKGRGVAESKEESELKVGMEDGRERIQVQRPKRRREVKWAIMKLTEKALEWMGLQLKCWGVEEKVQ